MQQLAAGPVRRRQASAIGQLPVETRPKLVNFVTGAIHFASIARLVGAARLEAGESFVDLGCGAGFQLAAACVLVPLREVIGLELLRGYLDCATKMFDHLGARPPSVVLRLADFNAEASRWTGADVVLCVSTCFEEIQMARIAENCRALRAGARVITLDRLLPTAHFGLVCRVQVQGEWGSAKGYVWLRNHAP
mmetsp:Transcript_33790/g.116239  ORF Transcript_33790/g.116239 Transcript_33790/m.116239 type:complete len:193 (-) Transcript_33790:15-593(-)